MDFIILLGILALGPVLVVGAIQVLIWKLLGPRVLRWISALVAAVCLAFLLSEVFAAPVYGNKSGLIGLGATGLGVLLIENLAIFLAPQVKQFRAWETRMEARTAAHAAKTTGLMI